MISQPGFKELLSLKAIYAQLTIPSFLVGVYVFSWFTNIGNRIDFFETIRFEFLLGLLLFMLSLLSLNSKKTVTAKSGIGTNALVILFYYAIFAFVSHDPTNSWFMYFNKVFKFALLSLFIYALIDNFQKLAFVLLCYLLAVLKAAQEGLVGWLTGGMMWENQGIQRLHGSIPMYGHPNSFSGFAVCLLPFIYCFYPIMGKYLKFVLIFLLICACVIILFTGSRTGYVATSIFALYVLIKSFKKSAVKFFLLSLPVIILAVSFMPDEYKERFESIFTQQEKEGKSADARKQILIDAVDVFLEHPMGVGIAAFPKVRYEMFGRTQDTHNLYMEVLTNTGFIGLGIFLFFVFSLIKCNKRIISLLNDNSRYEARFLIALSSAIIGYIYARLFLGLFGMDMYEIYWWFALGLTLANFYIAQQIKDRIN